MSAEFDPTAPSPEPKTFVPLTVEKVLIAAAMAGIALITGANVLIRYLTNASLAFTEEYSVVLMVVVALLGSSLAMASGRHIRIGYFADTRSPLARRRMEIAAMALVALCFAIVGGYGALLTWDEYRFEVVSPGLGVPQWLYTGFLPLLSLAVIGRSLGRAIRMARGEDA